MARVKPPIKGVEIKEVSLSEIFYKKRETTEEKRHQRRGKLLQQALEKIEKNLEKPYSLQDLSEEMYVHPRHMQRIFTSAGSRGFAHELRRRRLARGRELLSQGLAVSQVSRRLQYSHPSHFAKAFKKEYGILPGAWQRSILRKSAKKSGRSTAIF